MKGHLLLFLLSFGCVVVACARFPLRQYHYVSTRRNWSEALHYCRQHYSDLASFDSVEDFQQLKPDFSYSWVWIGLHDDPSSWRGVMGNQPNSWRWSATGETSPGGFQRWSEREPDYFNRHERCVLMDTIGEWGDKPCHSRYGFVCFTETAPGQVSYSFISTSSTWIEAQTYCRKHHTDLAVIHSSVQNSDVSAAASAQAWIGLYREPWTWTDQTLGSFSSWRSVSPNYPDIQHCGTENSGHEWDDEYCFSRQGAICQTVLKLRSFVGVTMKSSSADITQPLTNAHILQKVEEVLKSRGWTHFRVTWKTPPLRQTIMDVPKPLCDMVL